MTGRWTTAAARAWHDRLPWLVGCNFTPAYAINQLEMWQAETFDDIAIDAELGLAASLGMNVVRIYLHDLLWLQDRDGFFDRIDRVLARATARDIRVMLVLFDSCWDPYPELGRQRAPRPHAHNSGWVQSPGIAALQDERSHSRLEAYVRETVGRFADDARVIAWDIWNEPDNGPDVAVLDPDAWAYKGALVMPLMQKAFAWARDAGATQPLTSAVWMGDWSSPEMLSPLQRAQLDGSDVISFHNYGSAEDFAMRIAWLKAWQRPILCTEFMARPAGSTFEAILPIARAHGVGAFSWGLVRGKTQTHLPWDHWVSPMVDFPHELWFHDIFDTDGTPHDAAEVEFIRMMSNVAHFALTGDVVRDAPHLPTRREPALANAPIRRRARAGHPRAMANAGRAGATG